MKPDTNRTLPFDGPTEIKQSHGLMPLKKMLCVAVSFGLGLGAFGQTNLPTNVTPTLSPTLTPTLPVLTNSPITQPTNVNARVLTLEQCLQLALQNNLDIQLQRYNPLLAQYTLNGDYAAWEPVFNFSAAKNYTSSPGGINSITGLPFLSTERESESYNASISGTLPTGLAYTLNGPLSKSKQTAFDTNGLPINIPATWTANPGINLRQPLLKNFWIDATRLQISLSKSDLKISEQALRAQVMTTVTAVMTAYYNLIFSRENVEVNALALQLADELASQNAMKVRIGTLAPLDETQAKSQALSSKAAMLAAQHALIVQENLLKNLITSNYSVWTDLSPVPAEQLIAVPRTFDRQESWRRAIALRPDLIQAKLNLEKENVTLRYSKNQLYPELDVTGSYGQAAFSTSLGTALDNVASAKDPFYSYGMLLTVPLGNTGPRNAFRTAKVTVQQRVIQVKQLENSIITTVDNDVGLVQSTLQQVQATHAARLFAEDALSAEQKKLENGKSTSFNVLQLISNLTTAKSAEIRALADYNIAVAQLALDEGSTLEENRIDFKLK